MMTFKQQLNEVCQNNPSEVATFLQRGELGDGELYSSLFDLYAEQGEMPYSVAKARTADPLVWVKAKFGRDLAKFS